MSILPAMGDKLKKQYRQVVFAFIAVLFTLIAFQNCGRPVSSRLNSASSSSMASGPEIEQKQIIVRMKSEAANDAMATWAVANGLKLENEWPGDLMSNWSWQGDADVNQMISSLESSALNSEIEYVEPNYIYREVANYTLDQVLSFSLAQQTQTTVNIQQNELWAALTPGKEKPIVAVIDTGIDISHGTFTNSGALWSNSGEVAGDGIDNDGNGFVDDVNGYNFRDKNGNIADNGGHGTHCAGIILGVGQNVFKPSASLDTAKIQIMALKFIGPDGGTTSDAINAIYYAVNNGAKVLSNSWGGPADSRALEDAIKFAYDQEVVFVAAAGNSASNNDVTPTYPANFKVPNVISVAATDSSDGLAAFSNFGGSVDMGAPGVSILSTYPPNVFSYLSGTSMATPFVAGTAALQFYERPSFLSYQVKNILLQKSDRASQLAGKLATPVRLNSYSVVQETKVAAYSADHPVYTTRNVASGAQESPGPKGGCGSINAGGGASPPNPPWSLLAFLLIPIAVAVRLRAQPISVGLLNR